MANHKSAIKRTRQNLDRQMRNRSIKTRVKKIVKEMRIVANETSGEAAVNKLREAQAAIDKATKKGVIHKRTASRKISRLARLVKSVSA